MSFAVANPGGSLSAYAANVFSGQIVSFGDVSQTKVEAASSTDDSVETLLSKLIDKQKENFFKSFDKSSEENEKKKKEFKRVASMLMANADKDKNGLSKQELLDFDTSKLSSDDVKIVNNIISNFDNYDTNHDGLLSLNELQKPLPNKEFSLQELGAIAKSMSSEKDQDENSLLNMSSSFTEKILANYNDTGLPEFTSTVVSSA